MSIRAFVISSAFTLGSWLQLIHDFYFLVSLDWLTHLCLFLCPKAPRRLNFTLVSSLLLKVPKAFKTYFGAPWNTKQWLNLLSDSRFWSQGRKAFSVSIDSHLLLAKKLKSTSIKMGSCSIIHNKMIFALCRILYTSTYLHKYFIIKTEYVHHLNCNLLCLQRTAVSKSAKRQIHWKTQWYLQKCPYIIRFQDLRKHPAPTHLKHLNHIPQLVICFGMTIALH